MKKLTVVILTNLLLQTVSAQNEVLISGKVENFGSPYIQIGDHRATIDSTGSFETEFELFSPNIFILKYHGEETELFLEPTNKLHIEFEANKALTTLKFSGSNENVQNFLLEIARKARPINQYFRKNWTEFSTLPEKEYVRIVEVKMTELLMSSHKFFAENPDINPWLKKYYELDIRMGFNRLIYMYPLFITTEYMDKRSQLEFRSQYKFVELFDYDDPELLKFKSYINLMKTILRYDALGTLLTNEELKKSNNQWITAYQQVIASKFENDMVRNFWLHYYMMDHLENYGYKDLSGLMDDFNIHCNDLELKEEVNIYYQKGLDERKGHDIQMYKSVDGVELDAHIFKPRDLEYGETRPAILHFHGGGFSSGKPDWHFGYDQNGFVSIAFEYRYYDRHGTTPFEAIEDAKSAVRWVKENAEELQIDTTRIVASGNSCGAAMALGAALLDTLDNPNENLRISSKPSAIILNASGYDQTNKFGPIEDKSSLAKISGINIVKPGAPPFLVIHGSEDYGIPIAEAEIFVSKMKEAENICDFTVLEGAGHVPWLRPPYSTQANEARQEFLRKIGFIEN